MSYIKTPAIPLFLAALLFSIIFLMPSHAEHDPSTSLSGPKFSDHSKVYQMPPEWTKQPIKHESSAKDADIAVTLDGQLYHAWEPIINKYADKNGLKVDVTYGTCGLSAGKLLRKSADIGGFCCPPSYTDRLPGLQFHTGGIASIALIVHPDNPIDNITLEEARKIFMGDIYRWSELKTSEGVKGLDEIIQPTARLHCKIRPGHWRLLLDDEDLFSPMLIEVGAIPDMILQVAKNPRAIGYEILWMARYYADKGKVKILKINGYDPDNPLDVISKKYPLYRVYNFTTWEGEGVANRHAKGILDHLLNEVEDLDPKYSFIPSSRLKEAGWKFNRNELIGEPGM